MEPNSQTKLFLEVSALLTGFSKTELKATGMLETYYNTIQKNTDKQDIDYFFLDVHVLLNDKSKKNIEATLASQFMAASAYNGLAKNIIILWYTGNWGSEVISSASYIQGLMWNAAHTHPPGAKQPGYGSWAERPLTVKNS
ncbi:Membrane bound FAD containing D-sorbitol dehydrogenase [Flavobacterium sp. CF108]|uniref:sugar dehydrogenase complex small subunit n=1 Tax=unclassified Flavobacterium TaxID=196869 RepID=UPI0008B6EABF|nr:MULTISPECIES: sugar dehydrogenase complex small subunit [unclassified Flavobacterium]SEO69654.1 Membrane bound FAD containing D-sorbitol dehydrogenase [Flavobacterium sp. fv08]SHH90532.1 Membrane bound FAD containing D-sorbitol dehydrogenase [Flavobacterium sp. CF108]